MIAVSAIATAVMVATVAALVPANGGPAGGALVVVDDSADDELDPSVDGDLAVYTDNSASGPRIRYFDFLTGTSAAIPPAAPGDQDALADVSANWISFSRQRADGSTAAMVFDVATLTASEIAPGSNLRVFATAIGGDTIAFMNSPGGSASDIKVGRVSSPASPLASLGNPAEFNINPAVSPDGTAVVWARCSGSFTNCDVMKSTFTGAWSAEAMVASGPGASHPDTDGVFVVYAAERAISVGGVDIFFAPLAGGPETHLEIAGTERNPSIRQGVIAFEQRSPAAVNADIFVYVIATNTLFQVTNTPAVNETLPDVTAVSNGDVRVAWVANDGDFGSSNIYARTFSLPSSDRTAPAVTITSPADGAAYVKGQTVAADFSCQDEPGGSGLASCNGTVADDALIHTATVGSHSFTVTGTDNAGNSASVTNTYQVRYSFTGFLLPVENPPALNVARAGSLVPIKFSLGGNQGLAIFAPGYPASGPVACDATEPGAAIEETVTAGSSSLIYDPFSDTYMYVWRTNRAWKGTCRMLVVRLDDGSEHLARFRFK